MYRNSSCRTVEPDDAADKTRPSMDAMEDTITRIWVQVTRSSSHAVCDLLNNEEKLAQLLSRDAFFDATSDARRGISSSNNQP